MTGEVNNHISTEGRDWRIIWSSKGVKEEATLYEEINKDANPVEKSDCQKQEVEKLTCSEESQDQLSGFKEEKVLAFRRRK